jgi:hypothetical protein
VTGNDVKVVSAA